MYNEDEYEDEEEDLNKDPEEDTYAFLKLLVQVRFLRLMGYYITIISCVKTVHGQPKLIYM